MLYSLKTNVYTFNPKVHTSGLKRPGIILHPVKFINIIQLSTQLTGILQSILVLTMFWCQKVKIDFFSKKCIVSLAT